MEVVDRRAVGDLVGKISAASPLTVRVGKQAFYQQVDCEEGKAYDITKSVMALKLPLTRRRSPTRCSPADKETAPGESRGLFPYVQGDQFMFHGSP